MVSLKLFISIKPNQTIEATRFCPAIDSQIIFRYVYKQISAAGGLRSPWTLEHEMIGNSRQSSSTMKLAVQ